MADLIYTTNPASLVRFLKHVQPAGVPSKVTMRYLESVGFKTKNDRSVIPVLRALGFIDGSQTPTDLWKDYRDKSKASRVLGDAIRRAYSDLFATYPDAQNRDAETIRNFFSAKSNVAESTLRLAVATFKALANEAAFEESVARPESEAQHAALDGAGRGASTPPPPSLSIAIQVYVDKEMTAEQVDHVFASMARHFYGRE